MIPLPFTCLHGSYAAGIQDVNGNDVPGWAEGVSVPCFWWSPVTAKTPGDEPFISDRVSVDLTLVVDSALNVDQRDRFTVNGHDFEVVGLPKDYDHGPFGFSPNRRVVDLKWVG